MNPRIQQRGLPDLPGYKTLRQATFLCEEETV
jgi:hypothetical protein